MTSHFKGKFYNIENAREIIKLKASGLSYEEIAEHIGVPYPKLKNFLQWIRRNIQVIGDERGVILSSRRKNMLTLDKREELIKMRSEGAAYDEICQTIGVSLKRAYDIYAKRGRIKIKGNYTRRLKVHEMQKDGLPSGWANLIP